MFAKYLLGGLLCLPLWLSAQFQIPAGAQVVASQDPAIVIDDLDWQQDGSFSADQSTVVFRGGNSEISGTGFLLFYDLTLEKISGDLQLQAPINVTNELEFAGGLLDLNSQSINLANTGRLVNEKEVTRAYSTTNFGLIQASANLNPVTPTNPGNLGFFVQSNTPLGDVLIVRNASSVSVGGASSIQRTYQLIPTTPIASGLNMSFRFAYFDGELNGAQEGDLELFRSAGSGSYDPQSFSTRDATFNYVQINGVTSLPAVPQTLWTIAEFGATSFPVEWLSFEAEAIGERVRCDWSTATEVNSAYFELERSRDGERFEPFAQLPAAGNSEEVQAYQAWDETPFLGTSYYRIRQIDLDGSFSYSPKVAVSFESDGLLSLSPNPARGHTFLTVSSFQASVLQLELWDLQGRIVWEERKEVTAFPQAIPIDLAGLSRGVYTLKVKTGLQAHQLRLIVE